MVKYKEKESIKYTEKEREYREKQQKVALTIGKFLPNAMRNVQDASFFGHTYWMSSIYFMICVSWLVRAQGPLRWGVFDVFQVLRDMRSL